MGIFIPVLLPSPLLELSPPFPTSIQSLLLLQGPASVLSSPGKLSWPLQVQGVYLLCNLQHLLLTTQLGSKLQSWSCFLGTGFCPPTPPPSNPIILRLPGTNPGAKIGFLTVKRDNAPEELRGIAQTPHKLDSFKGRGHFYACS